jgi:hypothetical protein
MSESFKSLKGRRILINQPVLKESAIELSEADKAHIEQESMKKWTRLEVYAVGSDVTGIEKGDIVYISVSAIKGAEVIEVEESIKLMVSEYDVAIVW